TTPPRKVEAENGVILTLPAERAPERRLKNNSIKSNNYTTVKKVVALLLDICSFFVPSLQTTVSQGATNP
ncbi:MAG: hypothetical protein MK294_08705, partial [Rhodospirillales bacterium]|nr:hypothetical protein [Rhodospirillales bacterium]